MHVVKGKHGNLLCYDTSLELNSREIFDIYFFKSVEFGFHLFANMKRYTPMRLNNGFHILIKN
jgi:hypothetical protein